MSSLSSPASIVFEVEPRWLIVVYRILPSLEHHAGVSRHLLVCPLQAQFTMQRNHICQPAINTDMGPSMLTKFFLMLADCPNGMVKKQFWYDSGIYSTLTNCSTNVAGGISAEKGKEQKKSENAEPRNRNTLNRPSYTPPHGLPDSIQTSHYDSTEAAP